MTIFKIFFAGEEIDEIDVMGIDEAIAIAREIIKCNPASITYDSKVVYSESSNEEMQDLHDFAITNLRVVKKEDGENNGQ